jgi:hypothetical protein
MVKVRLGATETKIFTSERAHAYHRGMVQTLKKPFGLEPRELKVGGKAYPGLHMWLRLP